MSFEIIEKMIVNTIAGFGQVIKLPEGPVPEQLIAEEEIQFNYLQSEKPIVSCPNSPAQPKIIDQGIEQPQNLEKSLEKTNENQIEKQQDNQQEKQNQPLAKPSKISALHKKIPLIQQKLPPPKSQSRQSSQPSLEKQISITEDPLPFQKQSSVEGQPQNKKAPILKRLTSDLKESLVLAKKLEIKYKFPYSNDERLITVDFQQGKITTMVKNICNVIFLLVKTFFGQRNYHLAIVPVTYTVEQLRSFIIDGIGQNQKMFHNIKLIHPMIQLKELKDTQNKLSEVGLKDFSQLLFLAEMTFTWDPIKKGKSVVLSNNNLTANKKGQSDYQTILGTLALNSGRHYWEIKIEKYVDEEDIFIGIARKEIDLYTQPTTTGHFYGYICLCARKFGVDGQISDYGYSAVQNDTIGVLLEFRSGIGTLSFYRNGVKCGEAFNNLTGTFYPALCMFYGEVQVTLDSKSPIQMDQQIYQYQQVELHELKCYNYYTFKAQIFHKGTDQKFRKCRSQFYNVLALFLVFGFVAKITIRYQYKINLNFEMRGRSIQNPQPFQMRSPQRAVSPIIQVVPQAPQQQALSDSLISMKMEKVLMGFEIQRLNCVLLELDRKRNAMKNTIQQHQEREQVLLLEVQSQKQEINELQYNQKLAREKLNSFLRQASQQENQNKDQSNKLEEIRKLQEENQLLESKLSYLLSLNQLENKQEGTSIKKAEQPSFSKNEQLPEHLQNALSNLQNGISQYRNGNLIQNKYANALTMLAELINSHNNLLQKLDKDQDDYEVEIQQIQIYLTSLNQDIEALKRYETPKAVRRILNNQSPLQARSQSPSLSSEEVFSKIMTHIEHLQLDPHNVPTIIKQISLLNSLVRLKNEDLKLIGNNTKLRGSPVRYSVERSNGSIRVLTPIKYISPIRVSPTRHHTYNTNVSVPQRVSIIHPNISDSIQTQQRPGIADSFPQQSKDEFQNALSQFRDNQDRLYQLEQEKLSFQEQIQYWKQKFEEEIEKNNQNLSPESIEQKLMNEIKKNQELFSEILLQRIKQIKLYQNKTFKNYKNKLILSKKSCMIKQLNLQNSNLNKKKNARIQKYYKNNQINKIKNLLRQLQVNDEEKVKLKNQLKKQEDGLPQQPQQVENFKIQLCDPILIEKNKKQDKQQNEIDILKNKNIELQEQIIQIQEELNNLNSQQRGQIKNPINQQEMQTDSEKILKISQLEQENQKLKTQIKEVEQQRQTDLKEFQDMIGNGVQEQKVVDLMKDKQDSQKQIRDQQNQIDQLQQKQILLQADLLSKTKELQSYDAQKEEQANIPSNEQQTDLINQLQKQLEQAKQQYQDLLETAQQNITPNGLKEKVLQQQTTIHDQQDQIINLQQELEKELPKLQGQLTQVQQELQAAQNDAQLQAKRYQDLLAKKQPENQQIDEQLEISQDEAKELKKQNQELQNSLQNLEQEKKQTALELQKQQQAKDEIDSLQREKNLAEQLQNILQEQVKDLQNQITDFKKKEENLKQEIKNQKDNQSELIGNNQQVDSQKPKDQLPEQQQGQQKQDQGQGQAENVEALNDLIKQLNFEKEQNQRELNQLSNYKQENEDLRKQKIELQNQVLEKQGQINKLQDKKIQAEDVEDQNLKFQTDPEKNLKISQLTQENQQLKNQITQIEDQKKEDLKQFQNMIGNGVNEQQIVDLYRQKQDLEQEIRQLQNQLDKVQQESIYLQEQLAEKNKQLIQLHQTLPQDEQKLIIAENQKEIEQLKAQLNKAKQQYQDILEIQSQNLTPNGQKEKLLQNAKQIHELEQLLQEKQQEIETSIPQLQGQLEEFKQKYADSQNEVQLLNDRYQNLLSKKPLEIPEQRDENVLLAELQEKNKTQEEQIKQLIQDQKQSQTNQTSMSEEISDLGRQNNLLQQQLQLAEQQLNQIQQELKEQRQLIQQKDEEILKLKNEIIETNGDFWKQEYQKLQNQQKGQDSSNQVPQQGKIQQDDEKNANEIINQLQSQLIILQQQGNDYQQIQQENENLKQSKLQLQNELLNAQNTLNQLFSGQLPQKVDNPSLLDPTKALQISQLQQENQQLKKQIIDIEAERKEDLKNFENIVGTGPEEKQIISLISEKQSLQQKLRNLENQIDQLQQSQIILQSQLLEKNQQLMDIYDEQNQQNASIVLVKVERFQNIQFLLKQKLYMQKQTFSIIQEKIVDSYSLKM